MNSQMNDDIIGEINFFSHTIDGSSPRGNSHPKLGWPVTNYAHTPARITIHNLRGRENSVHLDNNGFELVKYDGNIHDEFDDNSEEQRLYYEDIITAVKKHLGASRVIIINHVIRSRGPPRAADQCDPTHKNPVFYPHVDYDPPAARFKVKEILGEEEGNKMMQNRFQIINVWRPLGPYPTMNTPLAICDYHSLDLDNDIHVSKVDGSESTIALYMISNNIKNAQRWYYLNEMRSNEMFIFKNFDSNPEVAQFAAHTAFTNEYAPSKNIEQCSIEVRCLVFYDE
jgi:hypothetical protein